MPWLQKKIHDLRGKPYEARVKYLRYFVIISVIAIIGIWMLTLHFRNISPNSLKSTLSPILNNIQNEKKSVQTQ
ncbi:hypothetical protein D4R52_01565 [bacterium]|nr:MAG: hypothetical protein D4R52_01565 [bacterium]